MPYQSITLKPGVDVEMTPVLNSAGWSTTNNIRFFEGLPQKIGGWTQLNLTSSLSAIGRGMWGWSDTSGIQYVAVGTYNSLELFTNGLLYDITPLRATTNVSPDFSTVISTKTVKIHDVANGSITGDRVIVEVPVSVGGIVIQGTYILTT